MLRSVKTALSTLTNTISACMAPVIPALVIGGFLKMATTILAMISFVNTDEPSMQLVRSLSDAPFYFLPILVAYASSLHFGVPIICGLTTILVLFLPSFTELVSSADKIYFLKIPVVQADYAYAVIPIIVLVWVMSHINRWLEQHLPNMVKSLFQPTILVTLSSLLGILFVCPLASLFSQYLFRSIEILQTASPVVAWFLVNLLWPLLIVTGMHWIFLTMAITSLGTCGVENGIMMVCFASAMTLSAVSLTAFLKAKSSKLKVTAASVGLTNFWSGAAEPCLYGLCLPNRKLLLSCMVGGGLAGIYQGFVGINSYVYSFPNVLSIFMFSSPSNPQNLINALIGASIAFLATFLLSFCTFNADLDK